MELLPKRRFLCWDADMIEKSENVTVHCHKPVRFEKPLSALVGKAVRLRFTLCDAHLYSFAFSGEEK